MARFYYLTDEQFARLSKSAREEIERLENVIKHRDATIKELTSAVGAERGKASVDLSLRETVVVDPHRLKLHFPKQYAVEFGMGANYVSIRYEDGVLKVYGSDVIHILPRSTNSLELKVVR